MLTVFFMISLFLFLLAVSTLYLKPSLIYFSIIWSENNIIIVNVSDLLFGACTTLFGIIVLLGYKIFIYHSIILQGCLHLFLLIITILYILFLLRLMVIPFLSNEGLLLCKHGFILLNVFALAFISGFILLNMLSVYLHLPLCDPSWVFGKSPLEDFNNWLINILAFFISNIKILIYIKFLPYILYISDALLFIYYVYRCTTYEIKIFIKIFVCLFIFIVLLVVLSNMTPAERLWLFKKIKDLLF